MNPFAGRLQILCEARVSGNQWMLATSPALIDTIELASLDGYSGPQISEQVQFSTDGIQLRCLFDVEAAAIDWRGFYKNAGA